MPTDPTITIPGWIPVSERLPEFPPGEPTYNNSEVRVLGAFENGSVREIIWERNWTAVREKNKAPRWKETYGRLAWVLPTHWMAMPPSPTEATPDA